MVEARKLLQKDELEEFQWSVQEYIKHGQENGISADWEKQLVNASSRVHISRYEALKMQCWQHAYEASGSLDDGLHLLLQKIYTSMYYHTAYEVQKSVGYGSTFAKIDTAQVEKVLSKPWAADGSDFSKRIWKNRTQLVQELDAGLTQGIIRGDPPDKLVKHLSDRFGVSESRAQTLVQTESAHFANQAQSDNFKELGVAKYEVVAALDKNTCYTCGAMDGQQFPLSEEKPGVNAPLFHARCRCCKAPVVEDETPGGERAARGEDGKTYYVPEDMTYNGWAEQHSQDKEVLTNAAGHTIIKVKKVHIDGLPPNSITQKVNAKGGIDRNYYDEDGRQTKQISNNGHGHKKEEAMGQHGEHAHDYYEDEAGNRKHGPARELSDEERKENEDVL